MGIIWFMWFIINIKAARRSWQLRQSSWIWGLYSAGAVCAGVLGSQELFKIAGFFTE